VEGRACQYPGSTQARGFVHDAPTIGYPTGTQPPIIILKKRLKQQGPLIKSMYITEGGNIGLSIHGETRLALTLLKVRAM